MIPTKQQDLIISHNENAVVIAAPGSGKTYVMSQKIKRDLKKINEHEGVIAISYTNKASNELKSRSLSNGENPKSSFFGTIDKFNLSEIIIPFGKHIFGIPKNQMKVTKISSLPNEEKDNFVWFDRNLSLDEISKKEIVILKDYFVSGLIMIETIGILANYVFTNSIACQNYIKARYKSIYIDEYQDSGLEQHQIFIKIKSLNITGIVVGDLNQSIYAFSGKDAKYLKELSQDSTFKYFMLDKNHRCDSSIINYSNYLLEPKAEMIPVDHNFVFFKRVDGDESNIATWLDKGIEHFQKIFDIKQLNKIAILTRTTRTAEMVNLNLETPHKFIMNNELDLNLNIWSAIFSNLLHFKFDNSFKFIDVIEIFTSYSKFSSSDLKKLNISKKKIERSAVDANLNTLKKEFINVASIIAPNSKNEESISLLEEVLNRSIELKSYEPATENEVNILTLHKSKGLEYDFIFHLDLYEWIFPNKKPGDNNDFDNPIYGDWKQDLNLHYVGITRARMGCCLVSSTKRTNSEGNLKNAKDSEFLWLNEIEKLRFKKIS